MRIIMIHDLKDPNDPQGRSYKEVNAKKTHQIPVGALVELKTGARLFVVYHGRDCDQTPLYWLSHDKKDIIKKYESFKNESWIGGYSEDSLILIST